MALTITENDSIDNNIFGGIDVEAAVDDGCVEGAVWSIDDENVEESGSKGSECPSFVAAVGIIFVSMEESLHMKQSLLALPHLIQTVGN